MLIIFQPALRRFHAPSDNGVPPRHPSAPRRPLEPRSDRGNQSPPPGSIVAARRQQPVPSLSWITPGCPPRLAPSNHHQPPTTFPWPTHHNQPPLAPRTRCMPRHVPAAPPAPQRRVYRVYRRGAAPLPSRAAGPRSTRPAPPERFLRVLRRGLRGPSGGGEHHPTQPLPPRHRPPPRAVRYHRR